MWKLYSVLAAALVGINNVLYKYVLRLKKDEYVLYGCFVVIGLGVYSLLFLTATKRLHKIKTIPPQRLMVMGVIGLLFFSGIIMFYSGLSMSPNISFNTAIFAGGKILTVLLATCLIFKETLRWKQILSLILILSGIVVFGLE